MDEGAGLESSAQGPEYGELVGLSCSSNGLACTPPEEDRQDPVDDPMLVRDSIEHMNSTKKSLIPKTTLEWEQLECFGYSHPHELMIFRGHNTDSIFPPPPTDGHLAYWAPPLLPVAFRRDLTLGQQHSPPPCVQINLIACVFHALEQ